MERAGRGITPQFIDSIKPIETRQIFRDGLVPGLAVRVTPNGVKTFALFYRHHGRPRMITLGRVGDLKLAVARERARDIRAKAQLGEDPQGEKLDARHTPTIEKIMLDYVEARKPSLKASTAKEYGYVIGRHVVGTPIGKIVVADMNRSSMRRSLEGIAQTSGPISANRLHRLMKSAFRWAVAEDHIQYNTFDGIKAPRKETPKDRVLTDKEILSLFSVLDGTAPLEEDQKPLKISTARATAPKIVMLLGTRPGETLGMRWEDLDLEGKTFGLPCWNIPPESRKNGSRLWHPLPPLAVGLIEAMRPVTGEKDGVFDGIGKTNSRWWDEIRDRVKALGVAHFTVHDLRRTCATHCGDLGASPFVVSRILGHGKAPNAPSVSGVYNRSLYLRETAAALATWSGYVTDLLEGREPGKVVPFRTA